MSLRQPRAFGLSIDLDMDLPPESYPFETTLEGGLEAMEPRGRRLVALARAPRIQCHLA